MAEQSVGWGFGKLAHNPNDQWLIKSANRIMGPFKLSEVIMGLELRHFTLMDEIAAPYGRWVLVRDEQALQAAVKELRNRAESIENTATMTHTMTTSKSFNSTDPFGVVTPPKTPNLDNVKEVKSTRNRTNVFSKGTFWVLGVLVIAGGLFWGWQQFSTKKRGKDSSAEGFSQVLELKSRGFHDRALALANKLKVSDKENPLLDLEIGTYQIALQNQNTAGRKMIERVLSQIDNKDALAGGHTALALSYMNENDFKSASDALDKALSVTPGFTPALINRAIANLRGGFSEQAEENFEPVLNQANNGVVILGSALASLDVNRKGVMPKRILPVLIQMLDDYLKNNFEFQQETYVLQAYIYNLLNKIELQKNVVMQLLKSDLESAQSHRYDILVDRSILGWKNLVPFCQTAIETAPRDIYNRSFYAYCLSKAGSDLEAKKIIVEAEAEAPRDPYVAAMKAYIMRSLGQDSESRASLGVALGQRDIQNSWLIKSKYCEIDRDDSCAQEALAQLLSVNPRSLAAHAGMARLELRRGNKKGASDWIARGQVLSQSFMPFWEIKSAL